MSHSIAALDGLVMRSLGPRGDRDALLAAASLAYAAATVFGSAVAMRNDVRGEPLGIHPPFSTRAGIALGWGAGVAAPWPMPALGVWAAVRGRDSRRGLICATLGSMCIAGTVVEPVTWHSRRTSRGIAAAIAVNLATSLAMIAAGLHDRHGAG